MAIVSIKQVTKIYPMGKTQVQALNGVDLTIEKGEFLAIAGPSGSGKSTLLNMLGCLDVPTEGTVIIDGQDLAKLSEHARATLRRKKLGFIFQGFNLIPVLTAFENVEMPLRLKGENNLQRVWEALDGVGLREHAHHRPAELSGGQQQRVAIARALVTDPLIVLADEPTANLDSKTGEAIIELMKKISLEKGTTFIFSTHDAKVMNKATRTVRLTDGRIEESIVH
ncbi:MAG TPA: ABC transporter ATP-binding protein [Chroococcales cyanobacterium]|jgi:putative ABC transport system ATP-binding protein